MWYKTHPPTQRQYQPFTLSTGDGDDYDVVHNCRVSGLVCYVICDSARFLATNYMDDDHSFFEERMLF